MNVSSKLLCIMTWNIRPFTRNFTRVGKIFTNFNNFLRNNSSNTLFNEFKSLKDSFSEKSDILYLLSCQNGNEICIKETRKKVSERVNQHSAAISNKNNLSLVYYIALLRV